MAKRPPFREPLRVPGQSADEMIQKIMDDEVVPIAMMGMFFIFATVYEWVAWGFGIGRHPVIFSLAGLVVCAFAVRKVLAVRPTIRNLKLGRDGERVVAQGLEALRGKGYIPLHDIAVPGRFNVDHVLVGPSGVFVIETKAASKPLRGDVRVEYDGEKVRVNGYEPDRDPIFQIKALTDWVRQLLQKETGRSFPLRGVVLYPGWFVNEQPKGSEVWVLNPKNLAGFLGHEPQTLSHGDIAVVTNALAGYVRESGKPAP